MRKVILPFVLLLFVFGCVKDENELSNETKTNNVLSVKYIDIEEIGVEIPILNPVIETHKMLALSSSSSNKARATQQEVNALKDVLVVYEEDEAVSYSVSFENQSIERFANVVVVKDENEVSQTIVIEYVPDAESVRLYNTGRVGIDELSGTMYVYGSLVDYIDQAQTKRQPQPKGKTPLFMSNPCGNMFGFNFGNGSMTGGRGGGGSGGTTVCSVVKTVKPCKARGAGEHGPSECGVGTGSTTIIRYQCSNINYKASISSTLSNMLNAIFLVGPCGSSVSPRGNIGINAQYKPATPCFDEAICAKADALIDELNRLLDTPLSKQLEKRIYEGGAFFDFAEAAVVALENGNKETKELNQFMIDLNLYQDTKLTFENLVKNYENIKHSHFDSETDRPLFDNYCAINLSHALLKSGIKINSKKVAKCWGCVDKNYNYKHAIRAEELAKWLLISNIDGVEKVKKLNGSNFMSYVSGKKGIIFFKDYWQRPNENENNRTGDHIDIWTGSGLASESFFTDWFRLNYPEVMESIFGVSSLYKSKEIYFWELK